MGRVPVSYVHNYYYIKLHKFKEIAGQIQGNKVWQI